MGDIFANLGAGFLTAISPFNLLLLVAGVILGLIFGVLPGLTLVMGVVLLLPFTYAMEPAQAIILLMGIYVAGTYGGAFTAILFNVPGEPIHVPMLWDGYPLARRGQAAKALGWAAFAALAGGLAAAVVMTFVSEPFAKVALSFSSPEYFAVIFLGLSSVLVLAEGSMLPAITSLLMGMGLATVGIDDIYGAERFSFGSPILRDGIDYLTVMIGIYAVAEVLTRFSERFASGVKQEGKDFRTALPSWPEVKLRLGTLLRGIGIGTFVGAVPGAGATIASFVSYGVEKQYGPRGREMGNGSVDGILVSQAAATASVGGAMVPLLTLGIPGSGATAVILGALLLHNVQPGPDIFLKQPDLIYTIFASLYLGVAVMFVVGLLSVKPFVRILSVPEPVVTAFIAVFCFVGAFAIRQSMSDVWMMVAFGLLGYFMQRFKYPTAPLVLGTILGPLAERHFMTTMISFKNDWTVFFTRPVAGTIMAIGVVAVVIAVWRHVRPAGSRLAAGGSEPPTADQAAS